MTGYNPNPTRPTNEEERINREEAERLEHLDRELNKVGVNSSFADQGLIPPARITAEPASPMMTVFQGRMPGFDPSSGEGYSRSWTPDYERALGHAKSGAIGGAYAQIETPGIGDVYSRQVGQREWGRMVQRSVMEGAASGGVTAHRLGMGEGRVEQGPVGQLFAQEASIYDPSRPPARVDQSRIGASSPGMTPQDMVNNLRSNIMPGASARIDPGSAVVRLVNGLRTGIGGRALDQPYTDYTAMGSETVAQAHAMPAGGHRLGDYGSRARPHEGQLSEPWATTTQRVGAGIANLRGVPLEHPTLGTAALIERPGGMRINQFVNPSGEQLLSPQHLQGVSGAVGGAFTKGMEQFQNMDPKMALANVQRMMHEAANGYLDKMDEEAKRLAGGDAKMDADLRDMKGRARTVANKLIYNSIDEVGRAQGVQDAGAISGGATRQTFEDLKRSAAGDFGPERQTAAQTAVAAAGGWNAVATSGLTYASQAAPGAGGQPGAYSAWQVAGAGGSGYVPGGPLGGGGGGGGGRRGAWQGQLGGAMYGAYIARRFWSYTGAPTMRAMDQFAQTQAGMEPLLTGQVPQGGAATLTASRARAQYALGEGAYSLFGGGAQLSSQFLQAPGMGEATAGLSVFGGAGLSASIMGNVLSGLGPSTGGIARMGGLLTRATPVLAGLGVASAAMGIGKGLYETVYGQQMSTMDMLGQAGQSVARMGAIGGAAIGSTVAGALGQGDVYAERLGQLMDMPMLGTTYGGLLSKTYGRQAQGGGIATRADVTQAGLAMNLGPDDVTPLLGAAYQATGERGFNQRNQAVMTMLNKMQQTEGYSLEGAASASGGFASMLGFDPGQRGFDQSMLQYGGMDITARAQADEQAQTRAGRAGQFRQFVSRGDIGKADLREQMGMFGTGQQAQIGFGGYAGLVSAGVGAQRALNIQGMQSMRVDSGEITMNQMQQGASMMSGIAPYFSPSALQQYGGAATESLSNLGAGQADIVNQIAGGGLGAMSFAANTGMLDPGMALTDISGRATYQTNLMQGMLNLDQVANEYGSGMAAGAMADLPAFQNLSGFVDTFKAAGGGGAGMRAGLLGLGTSETMANFFGADPTAGLQDYQRAHANRMSGLQQAGIGIGFQKIQMQRQFQYGGGDWRNPTAGSLWGIQDRMRGLQWQGQQAAAQFSLESMDVGNQFGQRQEGLTRQRMDVSQEQQRWQFGFQRSGMDLSRQFTMENRQYQDQLRGMSTAFALEDLDEGIRMSSGRERRQMVRQRERFVATTNVQDEQTERNREQQEEMWAREDEQFEKRREYAETIMTLDDEQYNMNVERRETLYEMNREDLERRIELSEALHELQNEQIEKQREYAVAQMDLAEKALGIQAASAAAQKEYNDDMLILYEDIIKPIEGSITEISKHDTVQNILVALEGAAGALDKMGLHKINALRHLADAVDNVDSSGTQRLIRDINTLMATSGYKG